MKVLVTGGAGFIGGHLVWTLIKKGTFVKVLFRQASCANKLQNTPVELVYADITDRRSLNGIAEGIDIVYHLAAQIGKWGVGEKRFQAINVQGTKNLLEECVRSGVKQFIFASTPGVQGKGYIKAEESLPYNPPYAYERSKSEAEKLVKEFHRARNLSVTILRPDFVYGPGDLRRLPLYRAVGNKRFLLIVDGNAVLHPTYIEDVVQAFCLLANNPVGFGQIYNIAGPRVITVREYAETIAQALNVSFPRLRAPLPLARAVARSSEAFSRISGKEPFLSLSKIEFLTINHGCDISKAIRQLGYGPKIGFGEGMRRAIDWYYRNDLL